MVELKLSGKQRRYVAAGMAAVAGLMAVSLVYQAAMHLVWRSWLKEASGVLAVATTQPASSQPASSPADAKPGRAKESRPVTIAAAISRRNIFAPPRPGGHGLTLTGVIGRIALFNSRDGGTVGIQEGESEKGVKVVSIRDYEVTIEFKGKKETLNAFAGGGGGGEGMARPEPGPEMPAGGASVRMEMRPGMEMQGPTMDDKAARRAARAIRVRPPDGGGEVRTESGTQAAP